MSMYSRILAIATVIALVLAFSLEGSANLNARAVAGVQDLAKQAREANYDVADNHDDDDDDDDVPEPPDECDASPTVPRGDDDDDDCPDDDDDDDDA